MSTQVSIAGLVEDTAWRLASPVDGRVYPLAVAVATPVPVHAVAAALQAMADQTGGVVVREDDADGLVVFRFRDPPVSSGTPGTRLSPMARGASDWIPALTAVAGDPAWRARVEDDHDVLRAAAAAGVGSLDPGLVAGHTTRTLVEVKATLDRWVAAGWALAELDSGGRLRYRLPPFAYSEASRREHAVWLVAARPKPLPWRRWALGGAAAAAVMTLVVGLGAARYSNQFGALAGACDARWAEVTNISARYLAQAEATTAIVTGEGGGQAEVVRIQETLALLRAASSNRGASLDAWGAVTRATVDLSARLGRGASAPERVRALDEWVGSANRLAVARKRFDEAAAAYRVASVAFPARLFHGLVSPAGDPCGLGGSP